MKARQIFGLSSLVSIFTLSNGFVVEKRNFHSSTRLQAEETSLVFLPVLIAAGVAAATVILSEAPTFDAWKLDGEGGGLKTAAKPTPPAPVPAPKAPAPAPAPALVAKDPAAPAPVAAPAPKPTPVSAKLNSDMPKQAVPDAKPLNQLMKEVGRTVEENKKIEDLIDSRRKKDEEAKKVAAEAATKQAAEEEAKPVKRSKRKLALRVAKKVIAPWRKWSNIK